MKDDTGFLYSRAEEGFGTGGGFGVAPISSGFIDVIKGIGYAFVGTVGVIGDAIKSTFSSKTDTKNKAIPLPASLKNDDRPIIFPEDPFDFNPRGMIRVPRPGTKNGRIIQWYESGLKHPIFEWDEDFIEGSHYHIMPKELNGKHGWTDGETSHFYPGSLVPEPFATYYFK